MDWSFRCAGALTGAGIGAGAGWFRGSWNSCFWSIDPNMYSSCIALTMYPEVLAGVALGAAAPGLVLDPNPPPPAPPDFGNCT